MTKNEYNFYKKLILESIIENYKGEDISRANVRDKIDYLSMRLNSEMDWKVEKYGYVVAFTDFFQGLGLNVPYLNHEILELAKGAKILAENATDSQEDCFLDKYWHNLGLTARKLIKNRDIPSYL